MGKMWLLVVFSVGVSRMCSMGKGEITSFCFQVLGWHHFETSLPENKMV
jgi:hypothetical protein